MTTDLSVIVTDGATSVVPGTVNSYAIVVTNNGPDTTSSLNLIDTMPAALSNPIFGTPSAGSYAPGSGLWSGLSLASGQSVSMTLSATIDPSATGLLTNSVTVSPPSGVTDPNPANNSATDIDTLTPAADLVITKTDGKTSVAPGTPDTYTIVVSNHGPSAVKGASVSDPLPAGVTAATWAATFSGGASVSGPGSGSGALATTVDLPVNASVTFSFTVQVNPLATGALVNTATVSPPAGVTDPNPANNSATDIDTLMAVPGIHIVKFVNGQDADSPSGPHVVVGSTVTFTYVVINTGNDPLANVVLTDDRLGPITSFTGDTNGNGRLDTNETWTYTKTATALPGQQTNVGTVTARDFNNTSITVTDHNPANYFGGITATWSQSPASGDYTNGSNWSTGTPPGPFDTAEFEASQIATISIGPADRTVGEWLFNSGAAQYNIEIPLFTGVLFDGSGIVINAGSVHIFNFGEISLGGGSSTGAALIDNFGVVDFDSFSSTGAATIHTYSGASVQFHGPSPGGSAQFITDAGGRVDLSANGMGHVTAGSIAGAGTYALGSNQLMVGLNGLSTEVSGLIKDGGGHGGSGASLVKVGPGTLKLSHAGNTYTGGTILGAGRLDLAALGAAGPGAITFASVGKTKATLEIDNAALSIHHFANPIDFFAKHDVLDLSGLHFHAGASATFHHEHLKVRSGGVADVFTLVSPHGTHFAVANDGHGGSKVTLARPHAATVASEATHHLDGSAHHFGDYLWIG